MTIDVAAWAWPQWTEVGLIAFNLLLYAILDGKPRTGTYSVGVCIVSTAFSGALLAFGGFFG